MAKPIDATTAEILKRYDIKKEDALWDCHGTWVMNHKSVEQIAAKAGITFDPPTIIEADTSNKTAVVCVLGQMGDRQEWSFGEAAPANNKNAYPWAMAEKRAKDRVALKLVGLAGFVYSEEEADDFKRGAPQQDNAAQQDDAPVPDEYQILYDTIKRDLAGSPDAKDLQQVWKGYASDLGDIKANYPALFKRLEEVKDEKRSELNIAKAA